MISSTQRPKSLAVIDLSWELYRNRYALDGLGIDRTDPDTGEVYRRPTGHIYGTVTDIANIAESYDLVILAVDSFTVWRKKMLPVYKSGRRKATGDRAKDFPLRSDMPYVLGLLTYLRNVVFIEKTGENGDGLEADDIISSIILGTRTETSYSENILDIRKFMVSVYAVDVDVLQVPGDYLWYQNFKDGPVDRQAYIRHKFNLDLDYVPHIVKTVRGDPSDKVPNAIPRFPGKLMDVLSKSLVYSANKWPAIDDYVNMIQSVAKDCKGKVGTCIAELADKGSETYKQLETNYYVTKPWFTTVLVSDLKKSGWGPERVRETLDYYQFESLKPLYGFTPSIEKAGYRPNDGQNDGQLELGLDI
jgi:hypothetical protein